MTSPKKSLGQNFLHDQNYQRKILQSLIAVNADRIKPVMEIGPGQGAITRHLLEEKFRVVLVEKDNELAEKLAQQWTELDGKIITGDFLKINLDEVFKKIDAAQWIGIGNLPYNVASQIFIKIIEEARHQFSDLLFMFQKEMALRFVAREDTSDYGLLSLWGQIYTEPKILFHLPPSVFFPPPKVSSSFVHFKMRETPLVGKQEEENFWNMVRKLFQQRRKMIRAVLKKETDRIPEKWLTCRPENLSVKELIELSQMIHVA